MNIDSLARLVQLAEGLRRANAEKWGIVLEEWNGTFHEILAAPVPFASDSTSIAQAIRAAQSAARRLANSGEARLGSASVGRDPDSSLDGRRFHEDLEMAHQRLSELKLFADT